MVTLIVFLATGEPVISEAPVSWQQCHKVVQALADGKRVVAWVGGSGQEQRVVRAECREVLDGPTS